MVPPSANVPGNPFVPNNVIFPGLVAFGEQQRQRGPYVVDVDSLGDHRLTRWVVSNIPSLDLGGDTTLKNVFGYVHARSTSYILDGIGLPPQINAGTTTSKAIAGYTQATFDTGLAGFKLTRGLRYTSERVKFICDTDDLYSPITGVEMDGSIHPAPWLTLGGNINYTDARFTDNQVEVLGTSGATGAALYDTYPDTPKWSGLAFADVTAPITPGYNAVLHGDVFAQSSNYFSSTGKSLNPGTLIDGYAVANFRIGVEDSRACSRSTSSSPANPALSWWKHATVSESPRWERGRA